MKTFILTLSRTFPATHKRKGVETFFVDKIDGNVRRDGEVWYKIHTIRANYDLWAKRIEQVQNGEAILSIRYWLGKPYRSKQVEICQLDKESGVGVQMISLEDFPMCAYVFQNNDSCLPLSFYDDVNLKKIASNDGLSLEDFKEWFKKYDLSKTIAIIHFTPFRY